jgi:exopolyphosphatase / guanosine-5'-triphosphate,3'-diphosphate pyrophosphatase
MVVMRVGIVDVGANTVRLLVAAPDGAGGVRPVRAERTQLGLGGEIERSGGTIGSEKLEEAAAVAKDYVRRARRARCDAIEILVTSPGRQAANGEALVEALEGATGVSVRVLGRDEEGALAWRGAVACAEDPPESVAVCDVGGGSTQLAVGTLDDGPAWTRSVDLGSLRLARRVFESDPPRKSELARARDEVAAAFEELTPPIPLAALATGGTARSLRRVVGGSLGEAELEAALRKLGKRTINEISVDFGVDRDRARTFLAGTMILAGVQKLLATPLSVAQGGLREGAALALLDEAAAATG